MDIRIGITQAPRELEVELAETATPEELAERVEKAVTSGSGMLWLTDKRGRLVGIPAAKLAYIELDSGAETRRVGFGAAV